MTRKNKIGGIFLASMLALTGLGISYAGFSDLITVYGNVNTANVDITVVDYSGTDLWKVWGQDAPEDEKYIFRGFISDLSRPETEAEVLALVGGEHAELVASSWAMIGTDGYDVNMEWDNIFPCIDFTADVLIQYTGSIPVKIGVGDFVWDIAEYDFSAYLTYIAYRYTLGEGEWIKDPTPLELPVQLHEGEFITVELTIHLLQDNALQGLSGDVSFNVMAMQWNEQLPYQYIPANIDDGTLTVTGNAWQMDSEWLNPTGYDFATNRYSYDLTGVCAGEVALQGFVDASETGIANQGDWSKYYAIFIVRDNTNKFVQVVFGNDWLGNWYELPAQPWTRIRMENNMGLTQPERYYVTYGGVCGYTMTGTWVGSGNGATIYPSNDIYFFQLIADPSAETFTLQVYAMGSGAPANPPAEWPKQNMFDYLTWSEIGSITVAANNFNFEAVEFEARLWASTQAAPDDTQTISWEGLHIGSPLPFTEIP